MIPLGILALIIGTNGDYYKFGYAILDYGLYWAAMSVIVFMVFALVGRLRLEMGLRLSGAYVAHIGLLLFIIGVVASSHYEEHKEYELIRGEPIKVFDKYTLQYDGYTTEPPQKYRFFLNLRDDDGNVVTADPTLFSTAFDNFQSVNPQPSIVKYASRDVYFTVRGIERTGGPPIDSLRKGQSMAFFDGKLDLTFDEFEFLAEERQKMMAGEAFTVKAKFLAKVNGHSEPIPVTASVTRTLNDQQHDAADVEIEGTPYHIRLAELRPDLNDRSQSMVLFEYFDENVPPPPISQKLYVEAFIKPYINFVWAGVIILMIGFGFSTFRRRREALVAIERAEKIVERRRAKNAADAEAIHRQGHPSDLQKRQESSNVDEVH
jgi:cytochrome c-type biogenesis protein CcmF